MTVKQKETRSGRFEPATPGLETNPNEPYLLLLCGGLAGRRAGRSGRRSLGLLVMLLYLAGCSRAGGGRLR